MEEKLIDFGGSDPAISDDPSTNFNNNFINSNNNIATANLNNNNLVAASENNDERGKILLYFSQQFKNLMNHFLLN